MLFLSAGLSVVPLKQTIIPTNQIGLHMELKGRDNPHQDNMRGVG